MENKELEQKKEIQKHKRKREEHYRVILTKSANMALESFTNKISDEISFSNITKSDVANWLLERIEKKISTSEANEILDSNFDETKALNNLLKNHKNGVQDLPQEIALALKSHLKMARKTKKAS